MAEALRIRTKISSKTLTLSDLERFIGKHVEVIVLEDEGAESATPAAQQPRFGTMAGKITVADDFDAPMPDDLQRYFEGAGEP